MAFQSKQGQNKCMHHSDEESAWLDLEVALYLHLLIFAATRRDVKTLL
jgi:hypothetical protein